MTFKIVYKKKCSTRKKLFILSSALLCYIVSGILKPSINKYNPSSLKEINTKRILPPHLLHNNIIKIIIINFN